MTLDLVIGAPRWQLCPAPPLLLRLTNERGFAKQLGTNVPDRPVATVYWLSDDASDSYSCYVLGITVMEQMFAVDSRVTTDLKPINESENQSPTDVVI